MLHNYKNISLLLHKHTTRVGVLCTINCCNSYFERSRRFPLTNVYIAIDYFLFKTYHCIHITFLQNILPNSSTFRKNTLKDLSENMYCFSEFLKICKYSLNLPKNSFFERSRSFFLTYVDIAIFGFFRPTITCII